MRRVLLAILVVVLTAPTLAQPSSLAFDLSYTAGSRDLAGRHMGGTEIRALAVHGGKLYAGNGYWKDVPGPEGTPGAQVLVLDGPATGWRVDHEFDELRPGGRRRHLAISALAETLFRTDGQGRALAAPVAILLASTWDITGARTIFARDDRSGEWVGTTLAQDPPKPKFLPQIRALATHRDANTGADLVFVGDTRGVFTGAYDPAVPGRIRWRAAPDFVVAGTVSDAFEGLEGRVRISSFAEARGRLYAAIGQQIWVRQDGPAPLWRLTYTNPAPGKSETGLRGLTAVSEAGGEMLLAAVEGNNPRLVRIDPQTGAETTELDLHAFLNRQWGTRVSYVIGAYNDMPRLPSDGALLIGLEAFIPARAPRPAGHHLLDVFNGLEGGAWFALRHPGGRYELHQVALRGAAQDLVAVRVAVPSPFPGEVGSVYLGGYDANDAPAHDTAWLARAHLD